MLPVLILQRMKPAFLIDNHVTAFKYAKEKNIPCTAHAGEARGADSVWETLEYFGPTRIGHGVRSIEDKKLVEYLRSHHIHLEICPSCNVLIDIYDNYKDHPIDTLYRAGISLSVNTDTRTITHTTLTNEYQQLQDVFGWTIKDFYTCNTNAIEAAFIPAALKASLLKKLTAAYEPVMSKA